MFEYQKVEYQKVEIQMSRINKVSDATYISDVVLCTRGGVGLPEQVEGDPAHFRLLQKLFQVQLEIHLK